MKQLIIKETELILSRAKDYYENNKELLRERAKNKYRKLSEEEKNLKREYGKKKDIIKKRLKEYQKKYREAKQHGSQMQICQ